MGYRQYYRKRRGQYVKYGRVKNLWLNVRRWLGYPKYATRIER